LFEIQAHHLTGFRQSRQANPASRDVVYALFGRAEAVDVDAVPGLHGVAHVIEPVTSTGSKSGERAVDPPAELARSFLRLANLPNLALDRLSRYEATLWRQVGRILFALDALDRRKPQERRRHYFVGSQREVSV
jgi:hypothetical protein